MGVELRNIHCHSLKLNLDYTWNGGCELLFVFAFLSVIEIKNFSHLHLQFQIMKKMEFNILLQYHYKHNSFFS